MSVLASDYTDGLSEKAIELVFGYLKEAYDNGTNREAREKMHNASCIAAMSFTNAFLGINHSLSHKVGGEFGVAHGRVNAILMPYIIKYNSTPPTKFTSFPKYEHFIADQKYAGISYRMGWASKEASKEDAINILITKVKDLTRSLDIPASLKECDIDEKEFLAKVDEIAERAFEDQCTGANPRLPLVKELKQILIDAYYGN